MDSRKYNQADYDVIILGAGASGLSCALTALQRGRKVLLIDHNDRAGMKVQLAGGGKCNFTNRHVSFEDYTGENISFCRSALAGLQPEAIIGALTAAGISIEEREEGQLFCQRSSKDLLNYLLNGCTANNCRFALQEKILSAHKERDLFIVKTTKAVRSCEALVIACGSPSWPKAGATSIGYRLAQSFGHNIITPRPALVGLLLPDSPLTDLSGISLRVSIDIIGAKKRICAAKNLSLLFTHTGLSGPAALQASLYLQKDEAIAINFLPDTDIVSLLATPNKGKQLLRTLLKQILPDRLASALLPKILIDKRVGDLSKADKQTLKGILHDHILYPTGTEGFAKAEAAAGGVSTRHISSQSMESKLVPKLYFCGEVLDVTGRLGGYNLHWAFASGHAAGKRI